ncbi:hypothetical protein GQ600_4469 [Phytophthora cactorum]|nr:hypothetical protein GQ600_4469 [Phytophthora cactorum]
MPINSGSDSAQNRVEPTSAAPKRHQAKHSQGCCPYSSCSWCRTQTHPIDLTKDKSSYESDLSAHHLERVTAISEVEEQALQVEDVTTSADVDQHALRLEGISTEQILDFWPDGPRKISTSDNPENLVFPDYGRNSHPCDCSHGCVREQCSNAEVGIYCTPGNCACDGSCSNSVYDCQEVELVQTQFGYGVRATGFIPVGSVIGEYTGILSHTTTTRARR